MNYGQLKTRATALASFEGWTDVSPSPDWPTLVNQAWQEFSWEAELIIGSETLQTVIGQTQYTLAGTYKALLDVSWNGKSLLRSSEEFERNLNPNWLNATPGTPLRWTLSAFSVLSLSPPPASAQTLAVRGIQQGPPMVLDVDLPGQASGAGTAIPANFHDAIAYRGAILHGQLYAQGEGTQRLAGYQAQYEKFIADSRESLTSGYWRRKATGQ